MFLIRLDETQLIFLCVWWKQLMEVQPTSGRCLRREVAALSAPSSSTMSRSQSMVATSCLTHHQHTRCRQHHAAEIHHPDTEGLSVGGHHSSPSVAVRTMATTSFSSSSIQQRQSLQATNSVPSRPGKKRWHSTGLYINIYITQQGWQVQAATMLCRPLFFPLPLDLQVVYRSLGFFLLFSTAHHLWVDDEQVWVAFFLSPL